MDDFVVNVKQIGQYPQKTSAAPTDMFLLQANGLGGPYNWMAPTDLVSSALQNGGWLRLAPNNGIAWNGASLTFSSSGFAFSEQLFAPTINAQNLTVNGQPVATLDYVNQLSNDVFNGTVHTFNGRTGTVQLESNDILRAGGILQVNPHFAGTVLVPTLWDPRSSDDHAASTAWVQHTICHWLETAPLVQSFNGRTGTVVLTAADVTAAAYLEQGQYIRAPNPALGDASDRVATCAFVDESIMDLQDTLQGEINDAISGAYAPIHSPQFTGIPTAPTAAPGTSTGQLATTAFVLAQVAASTSGVATWNGRTGTVVMAAADLTAAGGALLAGPVFTGVPQAPTAIPGNSSQQLATTAFVGAAIAAVNVGVTTFNTRAGAVTLSTADITGAGGAVLASPAFTGNPTAPTQAAADNSTRLATTAFVTAAVAASTTGVSSFNSRTGAVTLQANDVSAVGGALLAGPAFTGVPTAPTATVGTSSTQLATTAFVQNQIAAIASGVSSWNTRTGAITMIGADITAAGGALLNSPGLIGTPTTPTAAPGTSTTQIASTAFVQAALSAAPGGVSSFNSRTGAITLLASDISAAGGAPINSPSFTGTVTAPTATIGTNSNQVATTQFVMSAISSSGGVNSFNGRAGAVVMGPADIITGSGAVYAQADTAPATGSNNTLWFDSLHGQLYVQYKDPVSSALNWVIANSPPAQPIPALPGALSGLTMGWNSGAIITIAPGAACSDDGSGTMVLTAGPLFSKALGGPWAPGSGTAGLDTGTFAPNTWYHVFLIMNQTTAAVDALFSKVLTPTMPSGFSLKRRIGSIRTDGSSNILQFVQNGDLFIFTAETPNDYSNGGLLANPGNTLNLAYVPQGVRVRAMIRATNASASNILIRAIDEVGLPGNWNLSSMGSTIGAQVELFILTNTSAQINCVSGSGVSSGFYIGAQGWIDNRGK